MKVSYVTNYDAKDVKQWSGLGYYIAHALSEAGVQLEYCNALTVKNHFLLKLIDRFYKRVLHKNFDLYREPMVIRDYARQIQKHLDQHPADIIFCPSSVPIALLKTNVPIVFYTDTTFAGVVDFYPEYSNYCKRTLRLAHQMESAALQNAAAVIYSSDWASKIAIDYYKADKSKMNEVPFGANVSSNYNRNEVEAIIDNRSEETISLLFLGLWWERKGGNIAFEIVKQLNEAGVKAELLIVGCKAEIKGEKPAWLKEYGFVSKASAEGRELLNSIMCNAHFLLLPSLADCTPVVFSELNSFGVPSISTSVGGIPYIIKDGVNGKTFSLEASIDEYVDYIREYALNKEQYKQLALSSYDEYSKHLNWKSIGLKLKKIIEETFNKSAK